MRRISKFPTLSTKSRLLSNKLMLGGATAALTAVVGTAGIAAAHSMDGPFFTPDHVAMCKTDYKKDHFKNRGQCISWWNHHHKGHGYGYGGDGDEHHHEHEHHGFFGFFGKWQD